MKTTYICAECAIDQVQRILEEAVDDWEVRKEIMSEALKLLAENFDKEPALLGTLLHRLVKEKIEKDAFVEWKAKSMETAKNILEKIQPQLNTLKQICLAAIAANYIDFTVIKEKTSLSEFKHLVEEELAIDDFEKFEKVLGGSVKILYLTDNIGEHLFDALLVQRLNEFGKVVTVAGKEDYIMNDATVSDLKKAGFEKFSKVISIGSDVIGVDFNEASEEFKQEWDEADLIIAKGMGHYECLDNIEGKKIVFMLKAKCEPVARSLNVNKEDNVLFIKDDTENFKKTFLR